MNKQLQTFFEKTKQLHILLCIALLLIIVFMVAPIGKGFIKNTGQLSIIAILMYILFKNFTETQNFVTVQKNMKKDRLKKIDNDKAKDTPKGDDPAEDITNDIMIDIKNNTIASYILCGVILILLLYVIYSIFERSL